MYRRNQRAKVLFANVALGQKTPGEVDFDITFRDSQDVHLLEEKVSRVLASLHSNSQAVHMLHKKLQYEAKLYRSRQPSAGLVSTFDSIEGQLPLMRRETETQKRNVASLVRRIQGLAKLVSRSLFGPLRKVSQLTDQKTPAAPNPRISKRRDNAQPCARNGANGPPARPRRRAITRPDGTDDP